MACPDSTESLLPITTIHFGDHEAPMQTINARALHAFLEVGKDFSNWVKDRIQQYAFIQGEDYTLVSGSGKNQSDFDPPNLANQPRRGGDRRSIDYFLTIDAAKELSMVERNEKGKQARKYFIECEKRLKAQQPQFVIPKTYAAALLEAGKQAERAEAAEAALALEQAKVEAAQPAISFHDAVSADASGGTLIRIAAKELDGSKGAEARLVEWLKDQGWLTKTGEGREATAHACQTGYMRQRRDVINGWSHPVAVITPKGMSVLWHLRERGELFAAGVPAHLLLPPSKD